jgi:flagellar hook-length control protein FliK
MNASPPILAPGPTAELPPQGGGQIGRTTAAQGSIAANGKSSGFAAALSDAGKPAARKLPTRQALDPVRAGVSLPPPGNPPPPAGSALPLALAAAAAAAMTAAGNPGAADSGVSGTVKDAGAAAPSPAATAAVQPKQSGAAPTLERAGGLPIEAAAAGATPIGAAANATPGSAAANATPGSAAGPDLAASAQAADVRSEAAKPAAAPIGQDSAVNSARTAPTPNMAAAATDATPPTPLAAPDAGAAAHAAVLAMGTDAVSAPDAAAADTAAADTATAVDAKIKASAHANAAAASAGTDAPDAADEQSNAAATAAGATVAAGVPVVAVALNPGDADKRVRADAGKAAAPVTAAAANPAPQTALISTPASAAAAASPLKLDAGADTSEFSQALTDRISWLVDQNVNGAKLQVNPPQLGPIEVRISVQGDRALVWLSAHSAVTRDALESSSPKLREMLGGQGFGQVSVEVSQRSFQDRSPYPQAYEWTPPADEASAVGAASAAITAAAPARASGSLDAYA